MVFTNIPGGVVYKLVDEVLSPLGHRVVGVVTTPGPPKRRSSSYFDVVAAAPPGIDVIVSTHPKRLAAMLTPMQPDLIISGGFSYLIPADVIALPAYGAINIHPALLPKYRGPCAIEWALRNDDAELGFTIHRLSTDFDTGPVLAQAAAPIHDDDDLPTLVERMMTPLPELLLRALERVARGDEGDPQDEAQASYAGMFEPEWRFIDWTRPARTVHNQVRSWSGVRDIPAGALASIDGEEVVIMRTRLLTSVDQVEPTSTVGDVIQRYADRLVVQCGDGPIEVIAWASASG